MEFIELAELCDKGLSNLAQKDLVFDSGIYPVYGAPGEITKVDFFHQSKPYLGLIKDGAGVGRVMQLPANSSVIGTIQYIFPKENVDLKYLYYLIKYLDLGKANTGATIPHIYFKDYKKRKVKVREYSEQKHIGQILELIDSHLRTYKKVLEQYDLLIKSRFVEMFGDPVINNKKWASMNLHEISIKITNGNTPQGGSRVYINHGVLFIRSQNVWNNRLDLDDVVHISESLNEKMKETRLRKNDLLITKTGRFNTENSSLGRCALYTGPDFQANINGHVYLVRLKAEYNPNFILSILTSEAYKNLIRTVCVGGIDKRQLNKSHIELFPIIVPPIELQNQYIQFLSQINKLKADVQKSIDKAQLLMDSLMQEYFG